MPHCLFQSIKPLSFPFEEDGFCFIFEAISHKNPTQSLILVHFKEYEFFLQKRYRPKQNDFILKGEKRARNLPTGILKRAMRVFLQKNPETIIAHNLNHDTCRQNLISPFYKKIEDFLDFNTTFELEIGFGSGRHLLYRAEQNPLVQFIGIELHTPSIEQVLRQIELRGIGNIWIVSFDARVFLELLPSHLCQAIYLHFPVPWEKKPHRRVWSNVFVKESLRILKKDAMLELRTDDEGYFVYALETILRCKNLRCQINKNLQKEIVSKYEDRWLKQHKDIYELQIFSLDEDENQPQYFDFSFDFSEVSDFLFFQAFDTMTRKIVTKDWFLHIDSCFSNQNQTVLSVSFGDFNHPQHKFILLECRGRSRYLDGDPLPTIAAYQAHQALQKIILQGAGLECRD